MAENRRGTGRAGRNGRKTGEELAKEVEPAPFAHAASAGIARDGSQFLSGQLSHVSCDAGLAKVEASAIREATADERTRTRDAQGCAMPPSLTRLRALRSSAAEMRVACHAR